MAWFTVSDVAGRLLGKLAQWNDDEGLITHIGDTYFGGINKLKKLEKALKKIQTEFVDAERRLFKAILRECFKNEVDAERRLSQRDEDRAADFKAMLKKLKHVLYGAEELFEEIQIVEAQRNDQKSSAGWNCKLIKSLYMSASKPGLFRADVKQMSESMVQHVEAVMAMDWYSIMQQWRDHNNEGDHADDHLMPLKQCLAYCSLFPEDYDFKKTDLINLWMAQGYLEPSNTKYQTPQQVGHRYFLNLVTNGALKKAKRNQTGDVWKMRKTYHQLAVEMARAECLLVDDEHDDLIDTDSYVHLNHVSFVIGDSWEAPPWLLAAKQLRSLLLFPRNSYTTPTIKNMGELLSNLKCLRTLDLGRAYSDNVPHTISSIVWLKHLRYLNLGCPLESIPASITVLHYLQTLDLRACHRRMKCPDNLNKNVTLMFSFEDNHKILVDESSSLNVLIGSVQVSPKLEIFFNKDRQGAVSEATAADLKSKPVDDLVLEWSSSYEVPDAQAKNDKEELILTKLKPPSSVKSLIVRFWSGTRFPSWEPSPYINLPNLVSIEVIGCDRCRYLPSFSRLPSLRYLRLADLKALRYIEVIDIADEAGYASYFPSLVILKLEDLPELMGWSKETRQQAFCRLSELQICVCPKLMSLPRASRLDSICVQEIHGDLLKHILASSTLTDFRRIRRLHIDSVHQLSSLSVNLVTVECLIIKSCEELVSIKLSSESCKRLEVYNCSKLRHLSGEFLRVEGLKIWRCGELNLWDTSEDKSPSWEVLTSLTLGCMTKLKSFPMEIGDHARNIRKLYLFQLPSFSGLSDWLSTLWQLHELDIVDCPNLTTLFDRECGLKDLFLHSVTLSIERCQGLVDISFAGDETILRGLNLRQCDRLRVISGKRLVIERLEVDGCSELALWENNSTSSSNSSAAACVGSATSAWQLFSVVKLLKLKRSSKLEHLPEGIACLTELEYLTICKLPNLRQLPEWLEKLRHVTIEDCPNMRMLFGTSPGTNLSTTVSQRLKYLRFEKISKMEILPEGIACLSSLRVLEIYQLEYLSELPERIGQLRKLEHLAIVDCPKVTTLPESLWEIPSLKILYIQHCSPELVIRCQEKTGEYWPKLQHIPEVYIFEEQE